MNIYSVSGQNFLTLGEFRIDLKERGLLLIQGENNDDPSADSNGAGKSSLPDAISWALYGTTARGVTGDAVLNRVRPKECIVTVVLDDDDSMYHITRYRNPIGLKVQMSKKGAITPGGGMVDLTKGTQAETQEVINKIMGCSLEVFNAAVYAGQDAMPDLPGMTDKQLKLLIEEAAGVEVLAEAYAIARDKAGEAEVQLQKAKQLVLQLSGKQTTLHDNIKTYEDKKKDFEIDRSIEVKELKRRASSYVPEIKKLTEWLEKSEDGDELLAKIKGFEAATVAKKEELAAKRRVARIQYDDAQGQLRSITSDMKKAQQAVEAAKIELANLHKRIGEPCLACGKPVVEADLTALKELLTEKLKKAESRFADINPADHEAASKAFFAAQTLVDDLDKTYGDSSADMAEYADLTARHTEWNKKTLNKAALAKEVRTLVDQANMLSTKPNPYSSLLEEAENMVKVVTENLADSVALEVGAREQHELLLEAAKVFGPSGVRAHILDTVTPFLNTRTSEYLGAMTDGNIHAVWNTLQKTAKGELRERFNIEVTNDKGAEAFAGMSGGEKRKVRLATTMALQDMVASRAEKPLNIFIADEIDNALDESGLERLMTVLEQKARERGTVLIISHNSLSDWCDQIVTVTKKSGISTLEES